MNENRLAVLYCRSSKDRADISIEVQRRELEALAKLKGLAIVRVFTDIVQSGKDEDRPGFQALIDELASPGRAWSTVLALDTSRIARRAHIAYTFEDRECLRRGVRVIYKNLPDMEDAERSMFKSVMHGIDEFHSKVSRRKALAGMRANVRNGYRAGGRAPAGYRLEHQATGAVRDGAPVLKSKLVRTELAPALAAYLRDRASGVPRFRARERAGLTAPQTTLLSIERNALTYAGHTVWNMLRERGAHGSRYRPRAEWVVQRDTHEPLITDLEAEAVLARAHYPTRAVTRPVKHDYLLAGLLRAPAGQPWHGDEREFYRFGKGRRMAARRVERAVVNALVEDLSSDRWVAELVAQLRARKSARPDARRISSLRRHVEELERKIRRLAELAADATVAEPMLRTIAELERERGGAIVQIVALEREAAAARSARSIDEADVRAELRAIAAEIAAGENVAGLRDVLLRTLERVELDPEDPAELVLHYRLTIPRGGVELASPRRFEEYPGEFLERRVKLAA